MWRIVGRNVRLIELHQLPCLVAEHPTSIIEIEVSLVPEEHYCGLRRDVLQHLGLIVDVETHLPLGDHLGLLVERVHQDDIREANSVLLKIGDGPLTVASERDDQNVARPDRGEDVKETGCFIEVRKTGTYRIPLT